MHHPKKNLRHPPPLEFIQSWGVGYLTQKNLLPSSNWHKNPLWMGSGFIRLPLPNAAKPLHTWDARANVVIRVWLCEYWLGTSLQWQLLGYYDERGGRWGQDHPVFFFPARIVLAPPPSSLTVSCSCTPTIPELCSRAWTLTTCTTS